MPESGPVFRLVYRSLFTVEPGHRGEESASILEVSRSRNAALGVTGALLIWQEHVVQTFEGDEDVVRRLYGEIAADGRHEDVTLLEAQDVEERLFGRWSMARIADGGADVSAPPSPDDEEIGRGPAGQEGTDRMVATMRGHAERGEAPGRPR